MAGGPELPLGRSARSTRNTKPCSVVSPIRANKCAHRLAEIFMVRDPAALLGIASRLAVLVIDIDQVDVAGDVELARTQLAHADDPQLGALAVGPDGPAMQCIEFVQHLAAGGVERELGQLRHRQRHLLHRCLRRAVQGHQAFQHDLAQDAQRRAEVGAVSPQPGHHVCAVGLAGNARPQQRYFRRVSASYALAETGVLRQRRCRFRACNGGSEGGRSFTPRVNTGLLGGHNSGVDRPCTMNELTTTPTPSRLLKSFAFLTRWVLGLLLMAWLLFGAAWGALHLVIVPRIGELRPQLEAAASRMTGLTRAHRVDQRPFDQPAAGVRTGQHPSVRCAGPRGIAAAPDPGLAVTALAAEPEVRPDPARPAGAECAPGCGRPYLAGRARCLVGPGRARCRSCWTGSFRSRSSSSGTARWSGPTTCGRWPRWSCTRSTSCCATVRACTSSGSTPRRPPNGATASRPWRASSSRSCRSTTAAGRTGAARCYADFSRIDVAQLKQYADPGVDVERGRGAVRAWIDVQRGRVVGATADVALADVAVRVGARPGAFAAGQSVRAPEWEICSRQHGACRPASWPSTRPTASAGRAATSRCSSKMPAARVRPRANWSADRLDLAALAQIAGRLPLGEALHQALERHQPGRHRRPGQGRLAVPANAPVRYQARGQGAATGLAGDPRHQRRTSRQHPVHRHTGPAGRERRFFADRDRRQGHAGDGRRRHRRTGCVRGSGGAVPPTVDRPELAARRREDPGPAGPAEIQQCRCRWRTAAAVADQRPCAFAQQGPFPRRARHAGHAQPGQWRPRLPLSAAGGGAVGTQLRARRGSGRTRHAGALQGQGRPLGRAVRRSAPGRVPDHGADRRSRLDLCSAQPAVGR